MHAKTKGADNATVFVVDGHACVRDAVRALFDSSEFSVRGYSSAKDFLENVPPGVRGCLICNFDLPDMNGVELLERLQERDQIIPAIILARDADISTAVRGMRAGAADFIEYAGPDYRLVQRVRQILNDRD